MTPLKVKSDTYELWTELARSTILVDMPDGGKARIVHSHITVHFIHRKTQEKVRIKITGRGNHYWIKSVASRLKDEEKIHEDDAKEVFKRLVGKEGELAYKTAVVRLYCSP